MNHPAGPKGSGGGLTIQPVLTVLVVD